MPPRIPYIQEGTDPEMDLLYGQQRADQLVPNRPAQLQDSPDGPFGLNGGGLDSASLAVLQALQNSPRPRGFGQNFAAGLAGGLAGGRARGAQARAVSNAAETKRAEADTTLRTKTAADYARDLANHRWTMARDAAKQKPSAQPETLKDIEDKAAARARGTAAGNPKTVDPLVQAARQSLIDQRDAVTEQKRLDAEQEAADDEQYATDIAALKPGTSPVIAAGRKPEKVRHIINMVNRKLKENGSKYTHQQLLTLSGEKDKLYATMNREQMTGFRQAAVTVSKHLKQFEDFYDQFGKIKPPPNIRTVGKGTYQLAIEGWLGPDAQAAASGLEPAKEALPTEIAKVLAGGRVPYEFEVRKAQNSYIDPFLPKRASRNQVKSTRQIIRARIETQLSALPYAGGKDNPYLIDVSPLSGWDEGEASVKSPPSKDPKDIDARLHTITTEKPR